MVVPTPRRLFAQGTRPQLHPVCMVSAFAARRHCKQRGFAGPACRARTPPQASQSRATSSSHAPLPPPRGGRGRPAQGRSRSRLSHSLRDREPPARQRALPVRQGWALLRQRPHHNHLREHRVPRTLRRQRVWPHRVTGCLRLPWRRARLPPFAPLGRPRPDHLPGASVQPCMRPGSGRRRPSRAEPCRLAGPPRFACVGCPSTRFALLHAG